MTTDTQPQWIEICALGDLEPNSGVAALLGKQQIALFYLPNQNPTVYAIGNYDPISKAQVLSRGMVGELSGELVVASPVYKQHFRLTDGSCIEDETAQAGCWPCKVENDRLFLMHS